jgi:hypothetical protein
MYYRIWLIPITKATENESIEITFTVHKNLNAKILIAFL